MKNAVLLLAVATLISACAAGGVTRAYTGPERPDTDVAVINCVLNISVQSIDGDEKYHGAGSDCEFAVLPGTHRVSMKFYENDHTANLKRIEKELNTVEFIASKGMKYYFGAFKKDGEWIFKIQEVNPDKHASSSNTAYTDFRFVN